VEKKLECKNGKYIHLHSKFGSDPEKFGVFCWSLCLSVTLGVEGEYIGLTRAQSRGYIVAIYWWILMLFIPFLEQETAFLKVCKTRNYLARWRHKCVAKLSQNFEYFVKFGGQFCAHDLRPFSIKL